MCGISLTISPGYNWHRPPDCLIQSIQDRGPDHFTSVERIFPAQNSPQEQLRLIFAASVLALRGKKLVQQPIEDTATGSLLCWNGEAWSLGSKPIADENDATYIFNLLLSHPRDDAGGDSANWVRKVISQVLGPFAFIFFDAPRRRIFYGRDMLGRRSLVTRALSDGSIEISSIGCGTHGIPWVEVDAGGIHEIHFSELNAPSKPTCNLHHRFTSWQSLQKFPNLNRDSRPCSGMILHAQPSLVASVHRALQSSIKVRLTGLVPSHASKLSSPSFSILFSGGLDCTLIARVMHDVLPIELPIELLNVAFENPRQANTSSGNASTSTSIYERCPDRVTSRASHQELQNVCTPRQWRLITINIPYSEVQVHRARVVSLMHPHDTEMDLSIALALYFAARGCGTTEVDEQAVPYYSRTKVLFSGLGADELFGGYGRHQVAWKKGGEVQLADELELDFQRIGKRNLGRDDRVIACWGKEVRYPFLDEELVAWALQRPVWEKCDFTGCVAASRNGIERDGNELPTGSDAAGGQNPVYNGYQDPAKGLLRSLAQHLGLGRVAKERKRAIQFGARTAKMDSTKVKGTEKIQIEPVAQGGKSQDSIYLASKVSSHFLFLYFPLATPAIYAGSFLVNPITSHILLVTFGLLFARR